MKTSLPRYRIARLRTLRAALLLAALLGLLCPVGQTRAQDASAKAPPASAPQPKAPPGNTSQPDVPPADAAAGPTDGAEATDPVALAEEALATEEPPPPSEPPPTSPAPPRMNLLELAVSGGYVMIPIALMSFLVVVFGLERLLGLRRRKVLPPALTGGLAQLSGQRGGLDPAKAYALCQRYPSAAANVIRAMLLKLGRPHGEVEQAVGKASDREASRLYANVRWLNLAAGVAPLLGLLGTVAGMIQAFFVTANLQPGANRADALAGGIYVALVTTFAGLAVAIPAAVLAHLFEGRIQKLVRELDEVILALLPQLERFEGRNRANHDRLIEGYPDESRPQSASTPVRRSAPAARR